MSNISFTPNLVQFKAILIRIRVFYKTNQIPFNKQRFEQVIPRMKEDLTNVKVSVSGNGGILAYKHYLYTFV